MPRATKLKVFRTPIGFHDAYVAASSQKAAMEAWGSDKDLFARGEAELVTDAALTAAPLAQPGKVIKRLRGTAAEQIAALPPDRPRRATERTADDPSPPRARSRSTRQPAKAPAPRPSRSDLEGAEAALAAAEARHATARKDLAAREKALAQERREMERAQIEEAERLEDARRQAAATYEAAMRTWRSEE
ncbi:MAG: hypothetical protein JWL91_465 [Sphingomonas bacterium]|nr:hypothetical protein [Sphingomonas bacterium]MDB5688589.1 hypothetical protein [Sphingomonas bacterium]